MITQIEKLLEFIYNPYLYIIALFYCAWRVVKRQNKTSLDGVIGTYPASELFLFALCPVFFATIDIFFTIFNRIKKK